MADRFSRPLQRTFPVLACSLLAGCGGGGGVGTETTTLRASLPELQNDLSQFAAPGETFASTSRFVDTNGNVGNLALTLRPANDGSGNLILNAGGTDITLARDAASGRYISSGVGSATVAEAVFGRDVGVVLLVETQLAGADTGGFAVIGRQSVDVPGQRGKAVYLGPSAFLAVTQSGAVNGGSGGFILEADFDTRSVDGVIALTEAATSTQFQIGFENAPISGGGFSTTNLQQSGLNGSVTASNLNAAFYGAGAGEVGGTYTMDLDTGGSASWIAGAFLGNRQDFDLQAVAAAAAAQGGTGSITVGGETIVLGSGSVIGGSGSVYPSGASTYYNSNTGVSFGADGGGCYYVGDWSNC